MTTDSAGNASFHYSTTGDLAAQFITATATDPGGNTSEFSQFVTATGTAAATTVTTISAAPNPANLGQSITFTAAVTGAGPGTPTGTVTFTFDGGTPDAFSLTSPLTVVGALRRRRCRRPASGS